MCDRTGNYAAGATALTRIALAADCATGASSTILGTIPGVIIAGQP